MEILTLWQERLDGPLRVTPRVIGAFALVVALHAVWDWDPASTRWRPRSSQKPRKAATSLR
jgi:hypothetical protein